jgi:hypothetical protein
MSRLIMCCCIGVCVLITASVLGAPPDNLTASESAQTGRSVSDFLTPDRRLDINAVRSSGHQGPLDLTGVDVRVDPMSGAPTVAASPQSPTDVPDDIYWDNSISPSIPGINGAVLAAIVYDGKLVVGGCFNISGHAFANNIAAWDGSSWLPVGEGVSGQSATVGALAIYGNKLIAGGWFASAGGVSANNIASWDGIAWSPLGSGVEGSFSPYWPQSPTPVSALIVYGDQLIVGGRFTEAGGIPANSIAAWDGAVWSPLDSGIRGGWGGYSSHYPTVSALTIYDSKLIAGGNFSTAGSDSANCVAAWNGTSWSALGLGMTGGGGWSPGVRTLGVYDNKLVAGGKFILGGVNTLALISTWDGTNWSPLMNGYEDTDGYDYVSVLMVSDNTLMVGHNWLGEFASRSGSIDVWDGTYWTDIGFVAGGYESYYSENYTYRPIPVSVLSDYHGKLIIGGYFAEASDVGANSIASWDGVAWSPLGSGLAGDGFVALIGYEGKLMAGGDFTAVDGAAANGIVSWDGSSWSPLGSGVNGALRALTVYNGKLIAGGSFSMAGGDSAKRIASWDGSDWSPLGSGIDWGHLHALTVYNGKLIAGGTITGAGGDSANNIASWDGSNWSPLGSGVNGRIRALTVYSGRLIAGGSFTMAGGDSANNVASWDGSSWSPLGTGVGGGTPYGPLAVNALTVYDGKLVAGGSFSFAGEVTANCIASWDGNNWSALGSGIGGSSYFRPQVSVSTLTVHDGNLIAGGIFRTAGDSVADYVASWDGTNWSSLGTGIGGIYPSVYALTTYNDRMAIGGDFTTAGNKVAAHLAIWTKGAPTDVDDHDGSNLPNAFSLVQNYPNPFNPSTTIEYSVPNRAHVTVEIFNLLGQQVRTLIDEMKSPGKYKTEWGGTDSAGKLVSTGIYLYRLTAGDFVETKKMVLLK